MSFSYILDVFINALASWIVLAGTILLCVIPGWGLARHIKLSSLCQLLAAVIFGFLWIYLLEFGAYLLSLPQWIPFSLLILSCLFSLAYCFYSSRNAEETVSFPMNGLLAWMSLAFWIFAFQVPIVAYGPAGWPGDWFEHYERSLFFLHQLPADTLFFNDFWPLAARGPVFNANAGLHMVAFGSDFATYQIISTCLNTFPVIAMALLIRDMARIPETRSIWISLLLFAWAPFAVQQEIYAWTKLFSIGFVLAGIHFYRTGLMNKNKHAMALSFLSFALGILSHYMVVIFTVFFIGHFLFFMWKKHWNWRPFIPSLAICCLILATWFGYLFVTFGIQATLKANSTLGGKYTNTMVSDADNYSHVQTAFAGNMISSVIPFTWRHNIEGLGRAPIVLQADFRFGREALPERSDPEFELYYELSANQRSLIGNLGTAGMAGLMLGLLIFWRSRGRQFETQSSSIDLQEMQENEFPGWKFWALFFIVGIPLNILPSRVFDFHGTAHLNLQPFVFLVIIFILRMIKTVPQLVKLFLLFLFFAESAINNWAMLILQTKTLPLAFDQLTDTLLVQGTIDASSSYVLSYELKLQKQLLYLSDKFASLAPAVSALSILFSVILAYLMRSKIKATFSE